MIFRIKNSFLFFSTAFFVIFCIQSFSSAYKLPSSYILKLFVSNKPNCLSLNLISTVFYYNINDSNKNGYAEKIYLKNPGLMRVERETKDGQLIIIDKFKNRNINSGNSNSQALLQSKADEVLVRFFTQNPEIKGRITEFADYLRSIGVDTSIVEIGLVKDIPVYKIGEPGKSQIFVSKRSFVPIILKIVKNKDIIEYAFSNYSKDLASIYIPGEMKVYKNSVLRLQRIIEQVEVNPKFNKKLFLSK